MNWSFINVLMLFGALQGLLLVLILVLKKEKNKKARFFLTLILFALSMNLLYYFSIVSGITQTYPEIKLTYLPWSMLASISFYLYISFISPFQSKLSTINKAGFLPFVLFSIVLIAVKWYNHFSLPGQQLNKELVDFLFIFEEYFGICLTLLLGFLSYKKLTKIEVRLQQQFSNYNKFKLQFHKRLILIVLLFTGVWAISVTYVQLNNISSLTVYFSIWLFMAFVIQWIAWTGFIKDEALLPVFKNDKKTIVEEVIIESLPEVKSEESLNKNTFKLDKNNEHYKSLITLFEKDQVFLESELSLDILSGKLGISKSYLSNLINQTTDQNFYHFVNSYRADYLIKLFESNKIKNFTILSLAYEAGFNSKSTFQSFFKKYTGKTPSQYIKDLNSIKASV